MTVSYFHIYNGILVPVISKYHLLDYTAQIILGHLYVHFLLSHGMRNLFMFVLVSTLMFVTVLVV